MRDTPGHLAGHRDWCEQEVVFRTAHWTAWYYWDSDYGYELTTVDITDRPLIRFDFCPPGFASNWPCVCSDLEDPPSPCLVVGPDDLAWQRLPIGETTLRRMVDRVMRHGGCAPQEQMTSADLPLILAAYRAGCAHFGFATL